MAGVITLSDIAKKANVSKSTVSRVLNEKSIVNEKTRKHVLDAMLALGYQPNTFARGLASGRSMIVGVVTQKIGSPYYDAVVQGVIRGLNASGYSPLFVDGELDPAKVETGVQMLITRQCDGLILVGCDLRESLLEEIELPLIIVGLELPDRSRQCIFVDNQNASHEAVQHLIQHGHRRIAIVKGLADHQDAVRRYEGYQAALKEADIPLCHDLVCDGDFTAESGIRAVDQWMENSVTFSAVFCSNDSVAIGVRLALHRHGLRVPEDVSIVGFDDQGEAQYLTPPLTTVRQPSVEMGAAAAKSIVDRIEGSDVELPRFDAKLICRETVADANSMAQASDGVLGRTTV